MDASLIFADLRLLMGYCATQADCNCCWIQLYFQGSTHFFQSCPGIVCWLLLTPFFPIYLTIFHSFPIITWFLDLVSTKYHDIRFTSQPSTSQATTNRFATPGLNGHNGLRGSSSTVALKRTGSFLMGVVKQLEWDEFGAWTWTIRMNLYN